MTLKQWQKHQRRYEAGLWLAFLGIHAAANAIVSSIEIKRSNLGFALWEPWSWEISSALILLLLVPFILAVDHRFPLRRRHWLRHALIHLAFTLPFSLLHVFGMVALRTLTYSVMGTTYDFGDWTAGLVYEYLKDVRAYGGALALIYLYRFLLRRWQGEAQFVADGHEEPPTPVSDRLLVKKLGREFLIQVADIDWIESAGNYVTLHVKERLYPLRETMTSIEARLTERGFARVHRSAIVNLDRIREITPLESGDARAQLTTGDEIPISRRYRQTLKEQF